MMPGKFSCSLRTRRRGAGAVEYGLVIALVAAGALVAVAQTGGSIAGLLSGAAGKLNTINAEAAPAQGAQRLYAFTSHTFTSCGQGGHSGPSLSACRSSYSGADWAGDDAFFAMSHPGYQLWTVPQDGTYRIAAMGARGGGGGGHGHHVRAEFELTRGETLLMVVGQAGSTREAGGGGGGSFVTRGDDRTSATPLLIAGGGGGDGSGSHGDGRASQCGAAGTGSYGHSGGCGGNGGSGSYADGGAGFTGNGGGNAGTPQSFRNGALGGEGYDDHAPHPYGGFGGGGGGMNHDHSSNTEGGGGGGGYSGGGGDTGHRNGPDSGGGGGGSYVAPEGLNAQNVGLNTGSQHGRISIELIGG